MHDCKSTLHTLIFPACVGKIWNVFLIIWSKKHYTNPIKTIENMQQLKQEQNQAYTQEWPKSLALLF